MNRMAGQIFKGFNGNFSTPFNTNSRSGPGTHFQAPQFNGNTPFGVITEMNVRTRPNQQNRVGSVKAQVPSERNSPVQLGRAA